MTVFVHACITDTVADAVFSPECLAATRLLLLSADAASLSTAATVSCISSLQPGAGVVTCDSLRQCLLPLADVLQLAGTHVYLSTGRLHRAMAMMVALTSQLSMSEGQSAAFDYLYFVFVVLF